jgi:PAS domain S-box-containing protein
MKTHAEREIAMPQDASTGARQAGTSKNIDHAPVCRIALSDIPLHQRLEKALRQSEARHQTILQTAMDGFWQADTEGRLLDVNETYCRMSGYSAPELLTMRIPDLEAVESAGDTTRHLRLIMEQGEARFESRHRRKDGSIFDVEVSVQYRPTEGGHVVAFLKDITGRKMAETYREMGRDILQILNQPVDLRESISRVIAVLKSLTACDAVGIRLQDGDDFPYVAPQGFPTSFLLTENTLLARTAEGGVCRDQDGKCLLECTCGLIIAGKTDPANPLFTRGGSYWTNNSFPLLESPADQDPRLHPRHQCLHQGYASMALVPIRNNTGIVGLIQLNDRRKGRFTLEAVEFLEEIASHIGEALMRKRVEEERQILQTQLMQAQRLESIGRLASGVAHEINNPIMGIMGYAQLILDELGPQSPVSEFAVEINNESLRVAVIVKNLLSFARSDMQARGPASVADIIESTLSLIGTVMRHDQITMDLSVPADLPVLVCRSEQLRQVLMNLLTNARDALNEKYPLSNSDKIVRLSARMIQGNEWLQMSKALPPGEAGSPVECRHWVRITVEDHGRGIPPEIRKRIFEPFFSTKPRGKGTGLGLSISHAIVMDHGGQLSVECEEDHWTKIHVDLPVDVV